MRQKRHHREAKLNTGDGSEGLRRPRKRDFAAAAIALLIVFTILFGAIAPFLY